MSMTKKDLHDARRQRYTLQGVLSDLPSADRSRVEDLMDRLQATMDSADYPDEAMLAATLVLVKYQEEHADDF